MNTNYEKYKKNLNGLKEAEKKCGGFLGIKRDEINKTEQYFLKKIYYDALKIISQLRRDVVSDLWKILSPSSVENLNELPK